MCFQGGFGDFYFLRSYSLLDRWKADSDSAEAKSENNEGIRCQTLLGGFLSMLEGGGQWLRGRPDPKQGKDILSLQSERVHQKV